MPNRLAFCIFAISFIGFVTLAVLTPAYATVALKTDKKVFILQVADTDSARQAGLSGRYSMAADAGMLFSYSDSEVRCYWMKGMRFSLDILWLSASKRIEYMQRDVSPATYPQQYCPKQSARYVIELSAGTARTDDLHIGQKLDF